MKHQMQEKGWQQMQAILDKEMAVRNNKRNYLLPVLLLIFISILTYLVSNKHESPILPKTNIPMARNLENKQNISALKSESKTLETKSNASNFENLTPETNYNYSNKIKERKTSNFSFEPSNKLIEFENVRLGKQYLINQSDIASNTEKKEINTQPSANVTLIKSLTPTLSYENKINPLEIKLISKSDDEEKIHWQQSISLGIGQNITSLGNQTFWTNYSIQKKIFHKTSFVASAGFAYNSIRKNSLNIQALDQESSTTLPTSESFSSYKNNSSSVLIGDVGLGIHRSLSSKFDIGFGCLFSYLMSANVKIINSKSISSIADYNSLETTVNNSFNKYYASPYLHLGYSLNKKWLISASYSHDLSGFSNNALSKTDQLYFRQIRLGASYRLN